MKHMNNINNMPDALYTLSKSIQTSPQVYLWAYMVICHQRYRIKQINDNKVMAYVKSVQKHNKKKMLLCFIPLLSGIYAVYFNAYFLLFISTTMLFSIILYIPSQIKKYVADISCYLIKKYTGEYHRKDNVSMYMIAEKYSSIHKIPSLIDIIFYTDYIDRIGGIIGTGIVIATYIVYPDYILYLIICYYLIFYLISRCHIRLSFSSRLISARKI